MKANVNYNLEGDEEPGEGPKPKIYPLLGMVVYFCAPSAMLQNVAVY